MAPLISAGGYLYIGAASSLTFLAMLTVCTRIYIRIHRRDGVGVDDTFIIVGLLLQIGMVVEAVMWCVSGRIGFPTATLSQDQMKKFFFWFWINELTYSLLCPTIKMGILFFYRRLFLNGRNSSLSQAIFFAMICVIFWGAIVFGVSVFQCTPILSFWKNPFNNDCLDARAFFWFNSTTNLFLDIFILCMPLRTVWSLPMEYNDKLGLMVVLLFSVFTCIAASIRVSSLSKISNDDLVLTVVTPAIWTTVEPGVAIICACLPSLRVVYAAVYRLLRPCIATMCWYFGPLRTAVDAFFRLLYALGMIIIRIGVTIARCYRPRTNHKNTNEIQVLPIDPVFAHLEDGLSTQADIGLRPMTSSGDSISSFVAENGSIYGESAVSTQKKITQHLKRVEANRKFSLHYGPASEPTEEPNLVNDVEHNVSHIVSSASAIE